MKAVTWILRILSVATFTYMSWLVYRALAGYWDWDAPYIFIVTVFRFLSLVFFFLSVMMIMGFLSPLIGGAPAELIVGLYNTLILRMWYMQPYHVTGPLDSVEAVFGDFLMNMNSILVALWDLSFTFLYFLCAGIGIALFLQSLYRMEHKYVGGAFVAIQAILIIAAFRGMPDVPNFTVFPSDFVEFLTSSVQILALVSFAYLEMSFQMIYSHSVGRPVEEREETLKKQLLLLRQATRKQDAIERGEKLSTTGMSRSTGATAFSFLREAIERKVIGDKDVLENLDAISDVRRLQNFVDELLSSDPHARDELTARAAAPSSAYVIGSTLTGSAFRFFSVVAVSFLLMSPQFFVSILNLPPGVESSVALRQPEIVLLFLVPVLLLFPFVAMIISAMTQREEELTEAEKEMRKRREKERERIRKEAERRRRERERARKKSKEAADEWDEVLKQTYDTESNGAS